MLSCIAAILADMQGIARQKDRIRYFLTVINVFSKFSCAIPFHSKNAKAITAASGKCSQPRNHATLIP